MDNVKEHIKKAYSKIAERADSGCGCSSAGASCCQANPSDISESIGYSKKEMTLFSEANLGLGCGNPLALSKIRKGDTVLDLGSGAGFDAFLAVKRVGKTGKVIGVDMTPAMVKKARANAAKYGYGNTEFKLGDIEKLPLENESVDVIISNCVINLAPNKDTVFSEAFRVLRKGGKLFVSDIVLLKKLSKKQRADKDLIAGCVGGALLKADYVQKIKKAGFRQVRILGEDKGISDRQYGGLALESLKISARK